MGTPAKTVLLMALAALASAARGGETARPSIEAIEKALTDQQAWMNNRIGITDQVPPPWKPMALKRDSKNLLSVAVLGRDYRFEGSVFPSDITTWGRRVLAQPISLSVVSDGRRYRFPLNEVRVAGRGPAGIDLVSSGTARGIEAVAAHRIEYDGLILTRLSVSPLSAPVPVERLFLEIPMRKSAAKYLNYFRHFSPPKGLEIFGRMKKLPFRSPFEPVLWFGDEDVGLCWFAESDAGWDRRGDLARQMEIFDRGDARVLRLNFINSARLLDRSREVVFGIIATPAKPVKKDWRTMPALYGPSFHDWNWDGGVYYPGPDPQKASSGRTLEHARAPAGYFKTSIQYHSTVLPDRTPLPEHYLFGHTWRRIPMEARSLLENPAPPATGGATTVGSPASSMTDWLLWKWDRLTTTYGMRNLYFDGLGWSDVNRLHGTGYIDEDGNLQPTIPILASRTALKRFYVMMSEKGGDFNILIHGFLTVPPLLSFAHAQLSGEQFIIDPRRVQRHYVEIVPREELVGYFMGRQCGVVGVFLPELPARYAGLRQPTEEMMMLLLLHNIGVCPAFSNVGFINTVHAAMSAYGMADMEFVPYWENGRLLAAGTAGDVKTSLFVSTKDRRKVLLVVGNTGATPRSLTLHLTAPELSRAPMKGEDLLNKESFRIERGNIEIAVRGFGFRLIAVSPERPSGAKGAQ